MKKATTILFALSLLLVLWANGETHSSPITKASAGNIPDGMYTIVGEASHRCLEVPNSSCASEIGLQTFDCDPTETSNNQKFNVISDGSGNYTITVAHSDLCLEVSGVQVLGRTPIQQNVCSPDKVSQKWAMSQYGVNLQIMFAGAKPGTLQCMDVMGRVKGNYAPVYLHPCTDGTNQRWRLRKTTLNNEKGVICRTSPSHPEHNCSGVNDQQKQVHLGKTLTKAKCEEACKATNMSGCKWEGSQ